MSNTDTTIHAASTVDPQVRARITALISDYCYQLDDGEVDTRTSFFTDEASYKITTLENFRRGYPLGIMYCEGRGMMEDRIKALKTANIYEEHVYCHIFTRPQIRQASTDTYTVRTNFSLFRTMYTGEIETFATGKYLDTVRCTPEATLFQEKQVILDSRRIDTLLVLPI